MKNMSDLELIIGVAWDVSLVEKDAMGASQVIEVGIRPIAIVFSIGAEHPRLQHSVVPRH